MKEKLLHTTKMRPPTSLSLSTAVNNASRTDGICCSRRVTFEIIRPNESDRPDLLGQKRKRIWLKRKGVEVGQVSSRAGSERGDIGT